MKVLELHAVEKSTLFDKAYAALKAALLSGRLAPGDKVVLRDVSERLGISLTPVRDAVNRLITERLLERGGLGPGGAAIVPLLHPDEFNQLMTLRSSVEPLLASAAAEAATRKQADEVEDRLNAMKRAVDAGDGEGYRDAHYQFHFSMYGICRLAVLQEVVEGAWLRCGPIFALSLPQQPAMERYEHRYEHHVNVVDALRTNDGPSAAKAVRDDIESGRIEMTGSMPSRSRSGVRAVPAPAERRLVTPFARALDMLCAFTAQDASLGNRELAERTGLPASTVTRIARSLVELGYLHFTPQTRRYRLSASVLALGYAAIAHSGIQKLLRQKLREFAEQYRLHMSLGTRDRLEVIVVESCISAQSPLALDLHVGSRMGIASSPMGWALLAALPELERYYLMESVERRMSREWPRLRRRLTEAISQVHEFGYCTSLAEGGAEVATIAAPVTLEGQAPLVVSCIGSSVQLSRNRIVRELAPKLRALVASIHQAGTSV